jgi:hypothetical protein
MRSRANASGIRGRASRDNGAEFAFAGELADKRRQLGKIEAALSADVETSAEPLQDAA